MRLGITGANGFIGNHLLRALISKKHRPVAFLQQGTSIQAIEDLKDSFQPVWGDLLDARTLDAFVRECDVIFHLAGFNRYWTSDPSVFTKINYDGVKNLAQACLDHEIDRLIHVSSCITLGASDQPIARNEDSEFNLHGINFLYAETKKAGEDVIRSWTRMKGLPAVIVNPASAIGDQDYGPTPIGKPIRDICNGRWPAYVAGGACFIDVRDVVQGLMLSLEKGRIGEQYLLAGDNLTNQEFMTQVARAAEVPEPRIKVPRPVLKAVAGAGEWVANHITRKEPLLTVGMSELIGKYLYFDGRKAEAELGFKAGSSFKAIQRCVQWFKQGQEKRVWS